MKIKNTYIKKKEYIEKEEEMILKLFVKTYEEINTKRIDLFISQADSLKNVSNKFYPVFTSSDSFMWKKRN